MQMGFHTTRHFFFVLVVRLWLSYEQFCSELWISLTLSESLLDFYQLVQ